ncbi:hypothetical protein QQG55_29145 [Brugia pahangi]
MAITLEKCIENSDQRIKDYTDWNSKYYIVKLLSTKTHEFLASTLIRSQSRIESATIRCKHMRSEMFSELVERHEMLKMMENRKNDLMKLVKTMDKKLFFKIPLAKKLEGIKATSSRSL